MFVDAPLYKPHLYTVEVEIGAIILSQVTDVDAWAAMSLKARDSFRERAFNKLSKMGVINPSGWIR